MFSLSDENGESKIRFRDADYIKFIDGILRTQKLQFFKIICGKAGQSNKQINCNRN